MVVVVVVVEAELMFSLGEAGMETDPDLVRMFMSRTSDTPMPELLTVLSCALLSMLDEWECELKVEKRPDG